MTSGESVRIPTLYSRWHRCVRPSRPPVPPLPRSPLLSQTYPHIGIQSTLLRILVQAQPYPYVRPLFLLSHSRLSRPFPAHYRIRRLTFPCSISRILHGLPIDAPSPRTNAIPSQ
ncbi:hypothetical protein OH77DRAFT_1424471 [Trametes cingulata]|nr:hypothetical protein OH77DRAFT_1424471 [Trametes cingulata]